MNEKKPALTPAQAMAVSSRGGALLVSAAAGSGKTKVLVERLLGYVTDPTESCSVNDFLIITYTRAAANELRFKIQNEITNRLAVQPDNRHLRRQVALCYEAHIGTIHSFCTDVLRENAHLLNLPPDFRVADENESAVMKQSVLEDLIEARYDTIEQHPGFPQLVDTMSAGRDDRRLFDIILDAHTKLLSHANPEGWVKYQLEMLDMNRVDDVAETLWGAYLMADTRRKAIYWRDIMSQLLCEMQVHPEFCKAYYDSVAVTVADLDSFVEALQKGWDHARDNANVDFPRPKNIKGFEELKDLRKRCREATKKMTAVFDCSSADLLADMSTVAPVVSELLQLVLDFDTAYGNVKKKRGLVDFSDLEHMTLRLVTEPESGNPSPLGTAVAGRYKEIMVDEYQDCSGVQEIIFKAVSKNGSNLFMVGDVKQSIYRFRLAEPEIFLRKYKSYQDVSEAEDGEGRRILLSTNFRSQAGILDAVNFIFKNVMSEEFGEMAYTEREYLYPGRDCEDDTAIAMELDILDMSTLETENEEENAEKAEIEAEFVAGRIEELIKDGFEIADGEGGQRPVCAGDFAILLRSVKDKAAIYAKALTERNIPVGMAADQSFFDAQEVSVVMSLLEVIDNPLRDVPLIAVLSSPIYGFTPDELARIRLADKTADFYSALIKAAASDKKCRDFIETLNAFRTTAPDLSSDRFLWHIYNETNMLGIVSARRAGEARRENLMKLLDLAVQYEAGGYKGLFGFLTLIRKLKETGAQPGDKGGGVSDDAVKLMSIHKSKGLEFPIVILADTAKRFNNRDAAKPLLMHTELGVGAKVTDLKRRIEYPTLARLAVAKKLTMEMKSEELRVLYVAMTRARERLIVVATFADAGKELAKLSKDAAAPVPPMVLEGATSLATMILLPALTRPEAACLFEDGGDTAVSAEKPWAIQRISISGKAPCTQKTLTPAVAPVVASPEDVAALNEKFSFVYPYAIAPQIPSKLTATELKGRFADYEAAEEAVTQPYAEQKTPPVLRPRFMTTTGELTAAEKGTALHLAMQFIDYEKCDSIDRVRHELKRLRDKNFLSDKQVSAINPAKIVAFFQSETGRRVINADRLYREFKFSLLMKVGDYYDVRVDGDVSQKDDEILFQGVIDCCFEEAGTLHIIDFKTDYVTEETLDEKKRLYAAQLTAYEQAMARITGLKVKSKILYFFAIGRAEEI